jgi:hypothetical protein
VSFQLNLQALLNLMEEQQSQQELAIEQHISEHKANNIV